VGCGVSIIFNYTVTVRGEGASIVVTVDVDRPIPAYLAGKIGFNLELFPGALFGKPWIMDNKQGIFPQQPNGPTLVQPENYAHTGNYHLHPKADMEHLSGHHRSYNPILADDIIAEPYAVGKRFIVRPDDPYNKYSIETKGADLQLYDGRMNHNNGWFVLRSDLPIGATKEAVKWIITPNVVNDWVYQPGDKELKDYLLAETNYIVKHINRVGWFMARAEKAMKDAGFTQAIRSALPAFKAELDKQGAETPYGIPYRPRIWGAGWDIQAWGYEYYFLHVAYPDVFVPDMVFNALNFVLGCHPGKQHGFVCIWCWGEIGDRRLRIEQSRLVVHSRRSDFRNSPDTP
jgi:hypothetical protein